MKDKLIRRLNYFIDQVNTGDINTGICRDIVKDVKNYINSTEIELSERELDTFTELQNNEPLRMLLAMSGVYLGIIRNETIRFLYNNIEELSKKNDKYSLSLMLIKLQNLLDFTYFHADQLGIYRQVFTPKELKELQEEINNKWKK